MMDEMLFFGWVLTDVDYISHFQKLYMVFRWGHNLAVNLDFRKVFKIDICQSCW